MREFPPVAAPIPGNAPVSNSLGLDGVTQAFGRAVKSQLHPRMLFAMLLPFLIMFVGAIVLLLVALVVIVSLDLLQRRLVRVEGSDA